MKRFEKIALIVLVFTLSLIPIGCKKQISYNSNMSQNDRHVGIVSIKGSDYYIILDNEYELYNDVYRENFVCANKGSYNNFGENYIDADTIDDKYKGGAIITYEEYKKLCDHYNFYQKYNDASKNYFVLICGSNYSWFIFNVIDFEEYEDTATVYFYEDFRGDMGSGDGWFVAIPTDKSKLEMKACYDNPEIKNIKRYGQSHNPNMK